LKIEADRPISKDEAEAIKKHFEGMNVDSGSKYLVNFGNSTVKITFADEKEEEEAESSQETQKFDLGKGYRCPPFLRDRIPHSQPLFIDDGTNLEYRVMRALSYFRQVGLVGPTGVGKTHLVYRIASECGLPLFEVNCALGTSTYELVGKYVGLGKENWVDGTIVMWCRYGGILYLDEANMMRADVLSKCHPIMDDRGAITLTERENEIIHRHPYGYIVLSFNPYSIEYAGTKPLNVAFRRRVSAWFYFDYLSKGSTINDLEVNELKRKSGMEDNETAYKMVSVAAELRKLYVEGELPMAPSIGNLLCWAKLVSTDNVPVVQAADETIVDTISDDPSIKAIVKRIISSIFVTE
jgi:nitric oxide reductase NorQ protein